MRNVHALPTLTVLRDWLHGAGLRQVRVVDVTRTTPDEQRRTPWMRFQSLADFLDPADPDRTIEGHPAPTRALLLAAR
jgi:tRNA (mo5U34)-methyltransferase